MTDYEINDNWFTRAAAWLSQGLNCIVFLGHHDQTLSARAFLNRDKKPWNYVYKTMNKVFFLQEDHCYSSYMRDVKWASQILLTRRDDNNKL